MGRTPVISREAAARAALRIIDEDGPDALSLERIAGALGVKAPSLYHHFTDKAEILSEVARLVLSEIDPHQYEDDWREWLIRVSRDFHRAVLRHSNAVPLLIEMMPDNVAFPTFGLTARGLTAAGVDPSVQLLLMEGLEKLSWGWALHRAMRLQQGSRRVTSRSVQHRWPELAEAMNASQWPDEELFEASLRTFVDGVLQQHSRPAFEPQAD